MQQPIVTKPINFQDPVTLQQSILQLGIKKSLYPWYKQLILGWYSGFYLGIIYTVAVRCSGNNEFLIQNKGLQRYVVASIIPLTLMIIILNGYELITGNMAIYIPGLLSGKIPISRLLKAWGLVYLGNFAGSLNATGLFVYVSKIFDGTPWEEMVIKAAEEKMNTEWGVLVLRGIICGMFLSTAVYQAINANSVISKMFAVFPPIFSFVALGSEHCVPNMSQIPLGL